MYRKILTVVTILSLVAIVPAQAQICGDVTGDGVITVGDITAIISDIYFMNGPQAFPDFDQGDVDGHVGVTLADAVEIAEHLFVDQHTLTCSPTIAYSLAHVETDTIWVSRMQNIPDGIDRVVVPFRTTLQPNSDGVMVTGLHLGGSLMNHFRLTGFEYPELPAPLISTEILGDTSIIIMMEMQPGQLDGTKEWLNFVYERTEPGLGSVGTVYFFGPGDERTTLIEQDGDLLDVRFYTDYFDIPSDTLHNSTSALNFDVEIEDPIIETYDIDVYSAFGSEITFDLSASESWIELPTAPVGGWTSPATIPVTVDLTGLPEGSYNGTITVNLLGPPDVEDVTAPIPVSLTLIPPLTFPVGDLNCNGVISVADIAMLIEHLYISGAPIFPCK